MTWTLSSCSESRVQGYFLSCKVLLSVKNHHHRQHHSYEFISCFLMLWRLFYYLNFKFSPSLKRLLNVCYSTITWKVLFNQPHSKLGHYCAARCLILLTWHDSRRRTCLTLLCAKQTPFNKDESHHIFVTYYLKL